MISITLEGVTKRFSGFTALDDVSLQIDPGEIFFLLGPSGCGKTTLLRTIAGFHLPDTGKVLFDGRDMTRVPPHRRNTAMMFQSYALWPHLTVAENVGFGLVERKRPRAEIQSRVADALSALHLGELGRRRIHELSGGQQQRVALARALVIRPDCLLLDEPLSNLDARLRLEMRSEIQRICRESKLTAVYVTHDQKEAMSIADRMAVLDHGRIRQTGAPGEIYRRPNSAFVAEFMGETNLLRGKVRGIGDGLLEIDSEVGLLHASAEESASPAQAEAVISIRPESWSLRADAAALNAVASTVVERTYLGEMAQYRLAVAGREIKVTELNPRFRSVPAGTPLFASVAPEDIVVLKAVEEP